jgi:hypothetical protein
LKQRAPTEMNLDAWIAHYHGGRGIPEARDHNDWVPRVGFAYRLTDKTVIRGGVGIYYNR